MCQDRHIHQSFLGFVKHFLTSLSPLPLLSLVERPYQIAVSLDKPPEVVGHPQKDCSPHIPDFLSVFLRSIFTESPEMTNPRNCN